MTAQHPSGVHLDRAGDLDKKTGSRGEVCLEAVRDEMARRGLDLGMGGVRRLYTLFLRRQGRGDFLAYVLTYLDPTGETAAHNVVGGASR